MRTLLNLWIPSVPVKPVPNTPEPDLRHLFVSREILSARLNTIHNLTYYLGLMKGMREAILESRFEDWVKTFYRNREHDVRRL